jgi:hypothetical protein
MSMMRNNLIPETTEMQMFSGQNTRNAFIFGAMQCVRRRMPYFACFYEFFTENERK